MYCRHCNESGVKFNLLSDVCVLNKYYIKKQGRERFLLIVLLHFIFRIWQTDKSQDKGTFEGSSGS